MPRGVVPVSLKVEVDKDDARGLGVAARWARLKLNGVTIFSDVVYDLDNDGKRTDEQAATNLLLVFASRLGKLEAL